MTKRAFGQTLLAVLLVCAALLVAPCVAHADDATDVSSWAELSGALSDGATNIRLVNDAVYQSGDIFLTVKGSNPVTIDLNGHIIDRGLGGMAPQATTDSTLRVEGGGRHTGGILKLVNTADQAGVITGGSCLYGGGIWVYNNGTLEIGENVRVSGNTATYGGGVYVTTGQATLHDGAVVEGNTANFGGGICTRYVAQDPASLSGPDPDAIPGDDDPGAASTMPTCTIEEGAQVRNNVASDVNGSKKSGGGGAYLENGQLVLDGGDITANEDRASGRGGGVCVWSGILTINSGAISHNKLTSQNFGIESRGGGVYQHAGSITMHGGTIEANETYPGRDGSIASNDASNGRSLSWFGGGVYQSGGTFEMLDGSIRDNFAGDEGGGFCQNPELYTCSLIMHGGSIDNNTCGSEATGYGYGGGVSQTLEDPLYIDASTLLIDGGSISNNNAYTAGGGICSDLGRFQVGGTAVISGNHSHQYGGGILLVDSTLELSNHAAVQNNSADVYAGGIFAMFNVFVNEDLLLKMTDSITVADNTSNGKADNLYLYGTPPEQLNVLLNDDAHVGITIWDWGDFTSIPLWDPQGNDSLSMLSSDLEGCHFLILDEGKYEGYVGIAKDAEPGANGGIGGREEVKEPGSRDLGKGGDKVVNEVGKISPNAGSVSAYALKGAAIPAMGDETYNTSALVALALALLLPAALHKCRGS